jgi:hypothetical protein
MDAVFHERQRFRQKWIYLLLAAVLLPPLAVLIFDPNRPTSALVLASVSTVAIFALMLFSRLDVTVTRTEIIAQLAPFHIRPRRIAFSELAEAYARKYKPISEYGGWGIRLGMSGWAWNVHGDEGVQLVFKNGKRILIGSQRSAELERAIQAGIHSAA